MTYKRRLLHYSDNKMKHFAITALLALVAQSITLQDVTEEKRRQTPGDEMDMNESDRTIVGFLFNGFDFGELWENLKDEQREVVKSAVFDKTLEFNGFKSVDYKDQTFKFTDEQRIEQDKKNVEHQAQADKPGRG